MRRVCVTSLVERPHEPGAHDERGSFASLVVMILVAAFAVMVMTVGAMFGFSVSA